MSEICQFASAQDAGEEDALELCDWGDVPPALREKDRSLQGRPRLPLPSVHSRQRGEGRAEATDDLIAVVHAYLK
jgi:hypothetical protein